MSEINSPKPDASFFNEMITIVCEDCAEATGRGLTHDTTVYTAVCSVCDLPVGPPGILRNPGMLKQRTQQ